MLTDCLLRAGFLTLLLLNAFTAYFQNLSNFLVTKATSPLTLQVRWYRAQRCSAQSLAARWRQGTILCTVFACFVINPKTLRKDVSRIFPLKLSNPAVTSSQVLGNVKGVVAVVVSVLWFRNPISLYGMLGYGVTVGGVVAYSQARMSLLYLHAARALFRVCAEPAVIAERL